MADTMYVWSPISYSEGDGKAKTIKVGETVTQDQLGVDDDEWAYLVEVGSVRKNPYPDVAMGQSPVEHMKAQIAAAEGNTDVYDAQLASEEPVGDQPKPTDADKK